jgi:glycine betaine/choline ABC-type transport system substrate-binding protein
LTIDGGLTWLERLVSRSLSGHQTLRTRLAPAVAVLLATAFVVGAILMGARETGAVRIGSKNFTEQIVLGEIVAQAVEAAGLRVERRLNLGGTFICDRAIRAGDIDAYVEYSGTAHAAIFHEPPNTDPAQVFREVREKYAGAGLTLLDPLGFENTFAILIRGEDARRLTVSTIEDAVPHARTWRAGFGYEFLQRKDGLPGLAGRYNLHFAAPPRAMDLSLIYRALADRQVDLIAGDATSGLIRAYDLVMLRDNRHYFPPYDAAIVARRAPLLAHPQLRDTLARLSGSINVEAMRAMNYAVDVERRDPVDVAREFLSGLKAQPSVAGRLKVPAP